MAQRGCKSAMPFGTWRIANHEPALHGARERGSSGAIGADARAQPVDRARAVGVGLKTTNAPQAGVAERAIVEVHRVLRGDHDPDAEGACLQLPAWIDRAMGCAGAAHRSE